MTLKVNIKWGKEKFNDVEIDPAETGLTLKSQIFALTEVPPERQKREHSLYDAWISRVSPLDLICSDGNQGSEGGQA